MYFLKAPATFKYFKISKKNINNIIIKGGLRINLYVAGGSGDVLHRGDVRYSSLNYKSLPAGGEQRTRLDSTSSGTDSSSRVFKISKVLGGMCIAHPKILKFRLCGAGNFSYIDQREKRWAESGSI